jgi:CDP-diglyceride synthetase
MLSFVLAVIAAVIFFLAGFRVVEDTADIWWLGIGLAFLALAVAFIGDTYTRIRERF